MFEVRTFEYYFNQNLYVSMYLSLTNKYLEIAPNT